MRNQDKKDDWKRMLLDHFDRYPQMRLEDVIKLLYQRRFGPRHLHGDPSQDVLQTYLDQELATMEIGDKRDLEDIGNDYVRVHLDLIHNGSMTRESLLLALQASMSMDIDMVGARTQFEVELNALTGLCEQDQIPFDKAECESFIQSYMQQGIRPLHHSETYRRTYRPHYRVIHKDHLHPQNK